MAKEKIEETPQDIKQEYVFTQLDKVVQATTQEEATNIINNQ